MERPLPPLRHSLAFIVPAEHIRFDCCGQYSTTKIPSRLTWDFLRGRYRTRTAAEPTATTTSAASGGSSEELLGPRPAIRKQGAADAGCRNPSASGRNREELLGQRSDFSKPCQGAAEKSANATRCCCLARGFQSSGMSTKKAPPAGAPFAEPRFMQYRTGTMYVRAIRKKQRQSITIRVVSCLLLFLTAYGILGLVQQIEI